MTRMQRLQAARAERVVRLGDRVPHMFKFEGQWCVSLWNGKHSQVMKWNLCYVWLSDMGKRLP